MQRLQFLARLETYCFARRNRNLSTRSRIPANPGFPRLNCKDAETTQFDAVTLFEGPLHFFEHRFHCHFGLGFSDTRATHDFIDDVEFDQTPSELTNR